MPWLHDCDFMMVTVGKGQVFFSRAAGVQSRQSEAKLMREGGMTRDTPGLGWASLHGFCVAWDAHLDFLMLNTHCAKK